MLGDERATHDTQTQLPDNMSDSASVVVVVAQHPACPASVFQQLMFACMYATLGGGWLRGGGESDRHES